MKNQGIYGILNKITGQYYIGSAINFYKRKSQHLKRLNNKNHHSYLLQKDWNEDLFVFIFLEYVDNKENIIEREQWWIDNSNSYYNICKIAGSSLGIKRTEETKEKIRVANLGLEHPDWRNKIKSESQGGENHWTKKKKFTDEAKINMSIAQKKLYKEGYISPKIGKPNSKEAIQNAADKISISVLQFDLKGNLVKEWKSAASTKEFGFNPSHISQCCKNKRKTHKKFIWKYKIKELQ